MQPARRIAFAAAALVVFGVVAAPDVRAQQGGAVPCVLDKCLGLKPAAPAPAETPAAPPESEAGEDAPARGAGASGRFDFYVLALSWSPGFCATGGAGKAPAQCAAGSQLGFVVHGLWPQFTRGFPSDCGPAGRTPSRQALETVRDVYPDQGLARYEWMKHGTCSGKSPTDYFADVKRARDGVTIPEPLRAPQEEQTWVPIDLARAFSAANPGLKPGAMAVTCRQGVLEEVRLCLGKDLRGFVTCPEVARGSCRTRQMRVPGLT